MSAVLYEKDHRPYHYCGHLFHFYFVLIRCLLTSQFRSVTSSNLTTNDSKQSLPMCSLFIYEMMDVCGTETLQAQPVHGDV